MTRSASPTPDPNLSPETRDSGATGVSVRRAVLLVGLLALATVVASSLVARSGSSSGAPPPAPSVAGAASTVLTAGDGPVSFDVGLDRASVLRGEDGTVRMELTLRGDRGAIAESVRRSTDLLVVLDRSGSMGGAKIAEARDAVVELVERLGADDRFGLVLYDHEAEVLVPLSAATAENRVVWRRTIRAVEPRGNTALSDGLDLGLSLLERRRPDSAARLVLISDGLANAGDTTPEGLRRRARRAAELSSPLTAVGVGEDFDEHLMGGLADAGAGNFYFLRDAFELAQVFSDELGAARTMVAEALEVELRPGPGTRLVDAAGYPMETVGGASVIRPGTLFAGQERRIWLTFEVDPSRGEEARVADVAVRYRHDGADRRVALAQAPKVAVVDDRENWLGSFDRATWASSVLEDEYGALQQAVAADVKAGRRDEAKRRIEAYATRNSALNEAVASPEVAHNLAEVEELSAEVDEAFEGARQDYKQKMLSKSRQAAGWDAQRAGAKSSGKPDASGAAGGGR